MKENKNISTPKQGMNRESHISQLKNIDYTFMMNGNTESQVGEGVNITNEPSNNLAVLFPTGYKVIHYKKDLLNNKTYYFLTNPSTKKSSIGYIDDTAIEAYNEDIYQECVDCLKNSNVLGTPLEDIIQEPSHTYTEIINDNCLPIGEGFNFDINYPIKFSELKQEKGVTNIYWNDKFNKPRWMCLSDITYLFLQEQECGDPIVLNCMQPYKLLQFPEHTRIKIESEAVQTGGTLKMGVYEFYAAYSNLYGDEATNYSTPTNPISIWDENNNILNDETTDSFTNFAIRLKVSNLDTRYKYYKVVCVETNNVNRTKSAFIAGIYPTTDDTVLYTSSGSTNDDYIVTGNSSIKRRVDLYELSRVRPEYEYATGDVQSGGRKFMWGLKTKSEINLQPVVNLFSSLMKWQSNIAKESLYKTAIATEKYKGWMRNEVQPFAIRLLYKDGGYSANFPTIARPASAYDNETIGLEDKNYLSIIEDSPICTTTDRTKRWQLFNTATLDSLCSSTGEGTTVTESIEKKCIIEEAKTLTTDSITITILEGTQYTGLEEYIENNIDYITDPTSGDIYDSLGKWFIPENIPGNCTDITFEGTCTTPTLDREEIKVNTIQGGGAEGKEINTFNYKNINDYQKSLPSNFCTVYRTSQEDGKPIRDTDFEINYMGCDDTAVIKQVFFRDVNFQNESCTYATKILNNNIPTQAGIGYHHNYYGASTLAGLQDSRVATNTGNTSIFQTNLHKGALFFTVDKLGRDKIIFEVTKNSVETTNDSNDDISDSSTPKKLRYTFYENCSITTPIAGTTSVVFDTSTGKIVELDVATFPSTFYVAIDAPFVAEEVPIYSVPPITEDCSGVKTTKYRTAPPTGCFSVYTRDVQPVSVTSTWESMLLDKVQVYKSECDFIIPKVQDCKPIPYARGKSAYWESTETYPNNKELYDSSILKITPTDLQGLEEEDKALFKEYFVDSTVVGGTYILKSNTDFTCDVPIRHFKFPDNNISPFMADINITDSSDALIFPIGVYLDPAVVRTMLQVALNNNLITPEQLANVEGYEILKGDNSIHKSVIANGLGYDMYKYEQKGKEYFYANYPHNDLGKDPLHYVSKDNKTLIQHPFGGTNNNKFSFLSPDIFLNRITIPTEAVLSGYQTGTSTTTFQDVEDHPKWTLLGSKARTTADILSIAEFALEVAIKTAEFITQSGAGNLWFVAGVGSTGTNAAGAGVSTAAIATFAIASGLQGFTKIGKYRYEWLKIFDELGTAYNFASYGVSHGYHNKFIKNTQEGDYIRALPLRKYMRDGRYTYRDESTGKEVFVNNFQREHSIFLSTGKYEFNYLPEYYNYDNNNSNTASTSRTTLGLNGCASEEEIKGTVGSPYISLKNYVPDQFGIIDSVKWLTTGYLEKIDSVDNCNIMILGGNVCISRFTWKRKLPIFKKNIVGTADRIPFNYGDYKNIGSPVYFCDYKSDSEENFMGVPFPDINSNLNFDSCGDYKNKFYIRPPAKMYLFYYGITDFLVESEINCNFRYAQNSDKEFFYPQAGDIVDWTQEKNVPIKEPNRFFYNNTYSQQVSNTPYRVLDKGFSKEEWERRNIQDNAVIYSEVDNSENDLTDPWLTYKPLNWYEFKTEYGKLIELKGLDSDEILGRFENRAVKFNSLDKIQTSNGRVSIELGNAGIFAGRPEEYQTTDLGYAGTQHSDMVSTPYGRFFVDAKRGQVFQIAGRDLAVISDRTGQQPSGLKNWFREQLPFKILKKFPEADVDNKYKGLGISMGWDSRGERVFLTKKDYIPTNDPCLKYSKDIGFYTDCGANEVVCPTGYTYNSTTQLCEKIVESDNICPEGYVYNEVTKTCTLLDTIEAICTCTADVVAIGNNICSGNSTSIVLSTTSLESISYTWTVVQSGVTGATAGSGNSINQVLTASGSVEGTATYTITPQEVGSGCLGTPINVVATVKPVPDVIALPTSQSINSGETTSIQLSSSILGTTFSWTVVNSGTTGATNGSGNVIAQVVEGDGTATYTITPTFNGCVGTPINVAVTVVSVGIGCGGSVVASGTAGYYEVNAVIGDATGAVTVTLDAAGVPDRFQILWNGNVVADSLFIGDSLPDTTYENSIINATMLNKFVYDGAVFVPNGTIAVDYSVADIANSTGIAGTLRDSGSVGGQVGVVANYPTAIAKASDGDIKLSFIKTAVSPPNITIVAIGTDSGTVWSLQNVECPN